jgi:tetratricopeptide (TPR) repeat protein
LRTSLAVLAVAALLGWGLFLLNLPDGPLVPLAQLPGVERLASLAQTASGSGAARLAIWRTAMSLAAARPWLGYGPETLVNVFLRIYPPQLVYYQGRQAIVDRAHNLWLDLGLSMGVVGVTSFVALLTGFAWLGWRRLRATAETEERLIWVGLFAAVAGHLADMQFGFDTTPTATTFWLVLGLGAAIGQGLERETTAATLTSPSSLHRSPTLLFGAACAVVIGLLVLPPTMADMACRVLERQDRPLQERLAAADQAVTLWPIRTEYMRRAAGMRQAVGDYPAAERYLARALHLDPLSPDLWEQQALLYLDWGQTELARDRQAEYAARRAVALAPNVSGYYLTLGVVLGQQGRAQEAVAALEQAVALDATDGLAFRYLADFYQSLGRTADAARASAEAARWLPSGQP